ncbi:hypothetical protein [Microbacterium maritypicum]
MSAATVQALAATLIGKYRTQIITLQACARLDPWFGQGHLSQAHRLLVRSEVDQDVTMSILYTLDRGAHASGWWRNSEYETCFHLSIVGLHRNEYCEISEVERRAWAVALFGEHASKCWNEPPAYKGDPYRSAPASASTWHTRLFVDQQLRPIIPRGEVYTLIPFEDGTSPEKVFR